MMLKWKICTGFNIRGIIAGAIIALASASSILVSAGNPLIKAAIFPFGLLLICYGHFELFTGNIFKIGGKRSEPLVKKFFLLTANYISNLIGSLLVKGVIKVPTETLVLDKISLPLWKLFILGIACNFLVCLGVKLYSESPIATYICTFFFVACGFEHSIADIYYFLCAPSFQVVLPLAAITLGNIVGGLLIIGLNRKETYDNYSRYFSICE